MYPLMFIDHNYTERRSIGTQYVAALYNVMKTEDTRMNTYYIEIRDIRHSIQVKSRSKGQTYQVSDSLCRLASM